MAADGVTDLPIKITQAPHVETAHASVTKAMAQTGIDKGGRNKDQGYNFRGIDQILDALPSALVTAHLNISPRMLSREVTERKTAKGGALFVAVISAEYVFSSALDGSEKVVGPFFGEASDTSDKATNKAMSAAYKYMATQTFCIPFKGMEDADAVTHEVAAKEEHDEEKQRLIDFKADCGIRIAKCDTKEELTALWAKIERGSGFKLMSEQLPQLAGALARAKTDRMIALNGTTSQVLEDEIPY